MIVVSKDPAKVVPNILESYYETKVIMLVLRDTFSRCFAAILYQNGNGFSWLGGPIDSTGVCDWSYESYSIIDLLIESWNRYTKVECYVLENQTDVRIFIAFNSITNLPLIAHIKARANDVFKE